MATNTNTIKTRIQLKSDTEANWSKAGPKDGSNGFVPLLGELIVYTPDATHPFSRLKVGDGVTNVVNLPFIDAGTLNGEKTDIIKKDTFYDFPLSGDVNKIYIDLSTDKAYHYTVTSGYKQIAKPTVTSIDNIIYWGPGRAATAKMNDNILQLITGTAPQLRTQPLQVVTDV